MEHRDFEKEANGQRGYYISFEELIGNLFYILNCTDTFIDEFTFDLFDQYLKYTKEKFKEKNIKIRSYTTFFDWRDIIEHGVFAPFQNDSNSDCFDGMVMLKQLTKEEFIENYQQHPEEVVKVLCDECIIDNIISYHNGEGRRKPYIRRLDKNSKAYY